MLGIATSLAEIAGAQDDKDAAEEGEEWEPPNPIDDFAISCHICGYCPCDNSGDNDKKMLAFDCGCVSTCSLCFGSMWNADRDMARRCQMCKSRIRTWLFARFHFWSGSYFDPARKRMDDGSDNQGQVPQPAPTAEASAAADALHAALDAPAGTDDPPTAEGPSAPTVMAPGAPPEGGAAAPEGSASNEDGTSSGNAANGGTTQPDGDQPDGTPTGASLRRTHRDRRPPR